MSDKFYRVVWARAVGVSYVRGANEAEAYQNAKDRLDFGHEEVAKAVVFPLIAGLADKFNDAYEGMEIPGVVVEPDNSDRLIWE